MSKPAGYYDWDFRQRKAHDDAQVERENAEYEAQEADRKRQRAEREARDAKAHAASEIRGWQASADELNDAKLEAEADRTMLLDYCRGILRKLRSIHGDMNAAVALDTHNDLGEALDEFAAHLKDYN